MSKGSGGTRASRGGGAGAGEMPRKSPNSLSRYDGEEIAAGQMKVHSEHVRQLSDTELYQTESNIRESISVRGTGYKSKEDYTPEEKRLHKALDVVSGEISRRENAPLSDAESRLRSANKRVASTQNGSLANARAKVDQMNALADALGMGGNKRKRRR